MSTEQTNRWTEPRNHEQWTNAAKQSVVSTDKHHGLVCTDWVANRCNELQLTSAHAIGSMNFCVSFVALEHWCACLNCCLIGCHVGVAGVGYYLSCMRRSNVHKACGSWWFHGPANDGCRQRVVMEWIHHGWGCCRNVNGRTWNGFPIVVCFTSQLLGADSYWMQQRIWSLQYVICLVCQCWLRTLKICSLVVGPLHCATWCDDTVGLRRVAVWGSIDWMLNWMWKYKTDSQITAQRSLHACVKHATENTMPSTCPPA